MKPKPRLIENWNDRSVTLIVPGSSGPIQSTDRVEQVIVKSATYKVFGFEPEPIILRPPVEITAIRNPLNGRVCFIGTMDYYLADKTGMMGFSDPASGRLYFIHSFLEMPEAAGGLESAIKQFEEQPDLSRGYQRVLSSNDPSKPFCPGLLTSAPETFFVADQSDATDTQLESISVIDNIMRLDIASIHAKGHYVTLLSDLNNTNFHITNIPFTNHGSFLIDLNAKKVVKSVIDGQEMDLNTEAAYPKPKIEKVNKP